MLAEWLLENNPEHFASLANFYEVSLMWVKQRCLDASALPTNTSIFGKLNPDQNLNTLAMPKLPECVGVSRGGAIAASWLARNPHLVCTVRSPPLHPELSNESKTP